VVSERDAYFVVCDADFPMVDPGAEQEQTTVLKTERLVNIIWLNPANLYQNPFL
jgi:hypothetical protein